MLLSKLTTTLQSLNSDAFIRFSEYMQSDYFHAPKAAKILFDYIAPLYPEFEESLLQSEIIARANKELPTANKQAKAGSAILEAFDFFIALEKWKKNPVDVALCRLQALKDLKLKKQYEAELEYAQRLLDKEEKNLDNFYYRHQLTEIIFNGFDAKLNRTKENDLFPVIKTLDEFYAVKKLRYLCEIVVRKQVLGISFPEQEIDALLKMAEPFNNPHFPYVYLFVNVYQMHTSATFEQSRYYHQLIKRFVSKHESEPLPESIKECMAYSINWCIYWFNKGYEETSAEYIWWTELKIKHTLLLAHDLILPIAFQNIVVQAFSCGKDPKWIRQFIDAYSPHLPAEHRKNDISYANGFYYYAIKDYKEAGRHFNNAEIKDDKIFNAVNRRWKWMSDYEDNPKDIVTLKYSIRAFEKYVKRNKDDLHAYLGLFNLFIKYSKKLIEAKNKTERNKYAAQLEKEEFFPGKHWLVQHLKK